MNKKRIGLCFGCFIPLHKGHEAMIEKTRMENDRVIIGVCGYESDRGSSFIPFSVRCDLMKQHRWDKDKAPVTISVVDDHKIGLTGTFSKEAWQIWSDEFFKNAALNPYNDEFIYTWYTGEKSYVEKLKQVFPKHEFVLLDRGDIPISGTMIREHINDSDIKRYINTDFLQYLEATKSDHI